MRYNRRYIQFNDLVFDETDMISDYDADVSFKSGNTEYSYGHGSYAPLKADYMFVRAQNVNMTVSLHLKKIPCEYRQFYVQFAEGELSRPGRLWAVQNNTVIWAYAIPVNKSHIITSRHDEVEWDVEFLVYEGIWHKADKQRTFMLPYNTCTFMECKGYKTYNPCANSMGGDCCTLCQLNEEQENCYCCCVDEITPEMALCYHLDDLQSFYSCDVPYQLVYDCLHAEKFNRNDYLGKRLCVEDICDSSLITGRFYSETDIPTTARLVIKGDMHNPWITINGNTNIIEGDYDGALIIEASGDVYYQASECCEPTLLDPSVWAIPANMDYGWTIYPQNNSIRVDLNKCCQGAACVYIDDDAITT